MTNVPVASGATHLASLTGAEFVDVITGGPQSAVATTQQIANLSGTLGSAIRRSTVIQTANANIVPAAITGLSAPVVVGTYKFSASLYCTVASGTAGIAINQVLTTAVLGVCNFEAAAFLAAGIATQATTTATSGTVLFTAADQPILILIEGTFTITTAGTFGLQMCQNTSNASNSSVNVGSTMTITRIV